MERIPIHLPTFMTCLPTFALGFADGDCWGGFSSVFLGIFEFLFVSISFVVQVIAREEKGLWGVDYNRGEKITFTTSIQNRDQGREVSLLQSSPDHCIV